MNQKPDVSFIIPVYNMADTLPAALDSILSIRNLYYEIIVIDDGSTDDLGRVIDIYIEIVRNMDTVRLSVVSVTNSGRGAARNLGIEKASGRYISIIDADDTIRPDEFEKLWHCLKNEGGKTDLIVGQFLIVGENGEIFDQRLLSKSITRKGLLRRIALSPFSPVHLNAMLIKREIFDQIKDFDTRNINAEDKDVTIQLLRQADRFLICQSAQYVYHKHKIGRINTAKKRLMWLWFRQKTILNNYTGGIRLLSMFLQAQYDVAKLLYELIYGYRGRVR